MGRWILQGKFSNAWRSFLEGVGIFLKEAFHMKVTKKHPKYGLQERYFKGSSLTPKSHKYRSGEPWSKPSYLDVFTGGKWL